MYRLPEKQTGIWTVSNCARCCFLSICKSPNLSLTFHQTEISWLFYHFSICFVSLYIILCKLNSFMWIYVLKRKKLRGNFVFTTTAIRIYFASLTLMQITLHLADFPGDKNIALLFPDACPLEYPFYFDYEDFISFDSGVSFQPFYAGKLLEML